jgi:hypothetical protein
VYLFIGAPEPIFRGRRRREVESWFATEPDKARRPCSRQHTSCLDGELAAPPEAENTFPLAIVLPSADSILERYFTLQWPYVDFLSYPFFSSLTNKRALLDLSLLQTLRLLRFVVVRFSKSWFLFSF